MKPAQSTAAPPRQAQAVRRQSDRAPISLLPRSRVPVYTVLLFFAGLSEAMAGPFNAGRRVWSDIKGQAEGSLLRFPSDTANDMWKGLFKQDRLYPVICPVVPFKLRRRLHNGVLSHAEVPYGSVLSNQLENFDSTVDHRLPKGYSWLFCMV